VEWARACGAHVVLGNVLSYETNDVDFITRVAALAYAAGERAALNHARRHIVDQSIAATVAAEREACAKVCKAQSNEPECPERAAYCAAAIRARGQS